MKSLNPTLFIYISIGLVLVLSRGGIADISATKAPIECSGLPSCGDDITLEEVKLSYEELKRRRMECLLDKKAEEEIPSNNDFSLGVKLQEQIEKITTKRCEYDQAVFGNVCGDADTVGSYYLWAPLDEFQDGKVILDELIDKAATGRNFNRTPRIKYQPDLQIWDSNIIVQEKDSSQEELHLALCRVQEVRGTIGPPKECVTVAVITPGVQWLRTRAISHEFCYASASFRYSGAIDIEFQINTALGPLKISEEILRMLRDELNLSAERHVTQYRTGSVNSVYIAASGGLRNSQILGGGWREALDFDIFINSSDDGVDLRGTAHAMVSRQALGSVVEYQGLSDVQRVTYAKTLESSVVDAIKKSCNKFTKVDSARIMCE